MWPFNENGFGGGRRIVRVTVGLAACVVVAGSVLRGCMSVERMAPPVGPQLTEAAGRDGASVEVLQRGRQVYLTRCSTCHTIEPIDRYTAARWDEILPRMNEDAKLDAAEAVDLRTYILTAHRAMAQGRAAGEP